MLALTLRLLVALTSAAFVMVSFVTGRSAVAQTIDSFRLYPAADGADIIETYGSFSHLSGFQSSNGQKVPNTSLDEYSATIRFAHHIYIDGHPAGLQIFQSLDYTTNWQVNGYNYNDRPGMRKLQASDTTLSAFFWPYADQQARAYIYTAAYITSPDGSYSKYNSINGGTGNWQGDVQIGVVKGFTRNLSVEGAFDTDFQTRQNIGDGVYRNIDPAYRIQVWANWDWGNGLRNSLGYAGIFGGDWSNTADGITYSVPRNAERQQLRAAVSYWWTPRVLTGLELDHDVQASGGYQLGIGVIGRVKLLF